MSHIIPTSFMEKFVQTLEGKRKAEEKAERDRLKPKVVGKCTACKGRVIRTIRSEFDPSMGSPIIGPGYRNQCREVTSFHCKDCGLVYLFAPKEKKRVHSK